MDDNVWRAPLPCEVSKYVVHYTPTLDKQKQTRRFALTKWCPHQTMSYASRTLLLFDSAPFWSSYTLHSPGVVGQIVLRSFIR